MLETAQTLSNLRTARSIAGRIAFVHAGSGAPAVCE